MSITGNTNNTENELPEGALSYKPQALTEQAKKQAQANIDAVSEINGKKANAGKVELTIKDIPSLHEELQSRMSEQKAIQIVNDTMSTYPLIESVNYKYTVPTYSDLALLTGLQKDDAYQVEADGRTYIYNGTSFQPSGKGFQFGIKPTSDSKVAAGNALAVSGEEVFQSVKEPINHSLTFFKPLDNLMSQSENDYNLNTFLLSGGHTTTLSGWRTIKEPLILPKGVFETNLNLIATAYLVVLDTEFNLISEHNNKSGIWTFECLNDVNLVFYCVRDTNVSTSYIRSSLSFVNSAKDGLMASRAEVVKEQQKNDLILTNKNNNGNFVGAFRWTVGVDFVKAIAEDNIYKIEGVGVPNANNNQIQRTFSGLGKYCLVSVVAKSSNDAILYYGRGGNGEIKTAQLSTEFKRFTSILTFESTRIKFGGSVGGDIEIQSISVIDLTSDVGDTLIPNEDYYSEIMQHAGYFEWKKVISGKYLRHATDLLLNKKNEDSKNLTSFTGNTELNLRIKEFYLYENVENLEFTRLYAQRNLIRIFVKTKGATTSSDFIQFAIDNSDENIYDKVLTLYKNGSPQIVGYIVLEYSGNVNYNFSSTTTLLPSVNELKNSPKIQEYLNRNEQILLLSSSTFGHNNYQNVLKEFLISNVNAKIYNCGFGGCRMAWRTADGSNNYDAFCAVEVADALVTQDFSKQINANNALVGEFNNRLADLMDIDLTKPTTIFVKYIDNDVTGGSLIGKLWEYVESLESYDKTTFLGAMNYLVERLTTAYPHIKWVFFSDSWRYKTDKFNNSVPPYAFVNTANIDGMEYMRKEKENCERMGLSFFDFMTYGIQNNYNNGKYFVDATHFNYQGYIYLSEKLKQIYNSSIR